MRVSEVACREGVHFWCAPSAGSLPVAVQRVRHACECPIPIVTMSLSEAPWVQRIAHLIETQGTQKDSQAGGNQRWLATTPLTRARSNLKPCTHICSRIGKTTQGGIRYCCGRQTSRSRTSNSKRTCTAPHSNTGSGIPNSNRPHTSCKHL